MKKVKSLLSTVMAVAVLTTLSPVLSFHVAAAAESPYLSRMNQLTAKDFSYAHLMTREDFCVVIAKLFSDQTTGGAKQTLPFVDGAKIKQESIPYLTQLYDRGILLGSEQNGQLFMDPESPITRQEAFTFLGRILSGTSDRSVSFTDANEIAAYAQTYIAWFAESRIAVGYPDGSLKPEANMSAGELASLTMKALDYQSLNKLKLTTFMGTGSRGHLDGDVKTARFSFPADIAIDKNGEVIVIDTYNSAIRTIKASKAVTLSGKSVEVDESGMPKGGYLDTDVQQALFSLPWGADVSSANELFIADSGNNCIRFIRDGNVYTLGETTAGYKEGISSVAQFNNPRAIAMDQENNIYVADTLNDCIRKIDSKGQVTTVAGTPMSEGDGDGPASQAKFRAPQGIAVEKDGQVIYVADTGNHKIKKIENGMVTTVAGTFTETDADGDPLGGYMDGIAESAQFCLPMGLTLAEGVLLVADSGNNVIRAMTKAGVVVTVAGNGEPGDQESGARESGLNQPSGVEYDNKTLYIADTLNNKIKVMPFDPGILE